MNLRDKLRKFHLERVSLNMSLVNAELSFQDADQDAAWELYIEMLTRVVTQPLPSEAGDEKAALDSLYSLFPITREVLRRNGRGAINFSMVAIPVLNQVIRPFTARWHRKSSSGALNNDGGRAAFRKELEFLQQDLRNYNRLLADIAGVEDLTDLERVDGGSNGSSAKT